MKHKTPFSAGAGAGARALGLALLGLAAGCSSTKPPPVYVGAAEQLERAAAEQAASPGTAANATANTAATYLKLVEQMQRDGLWFASLAHIDSLEQRWGVTPESTRLRADALRQTEQTGESRKMYGKLMGTPLEGAGYHGLGLLAGAQSDFAGAVQMLEQAQRRNPTDGMLLSDLGYANLRAGRIAQARLPLMQAFQLQPDSPQVQANVALYLLASGQADQAQALMDARSMSPATRKAVLESAQQIASGRDGRAADVTVAALRPALQADTGPGLALKAVGWPRRAEPGSALPPSISAPTGVRP